MEIVITKTPLRLSFLGGGTDLRSFYKLEDGKVLSCSINKFLYVIVKKNQSYVDFKYRVNWSKTEFANRLDNIKHPIVREVLRYFKIKFPIEISTFAEIPANTGMGSSSAFAVGLIKAVSKLLGKNYSNKKIAKIASWIEVDVLKRNMGKQDHYGCSVGGLKFLTFKKNENVLIQKIDINKKHKIKLNNSLFVFFLNKKKDTSYILESQKKLLPKNITLLKKIKQTAIFTNNQFKKNKFSLKLLGEQINTNWNLKKENNKKVAFDLANKIFEYGISQNILGGKLLGAGGGGYFFFLTTLQKAKKIKKKFNYASLLQLKICEEGSKFLYLRK